MKHDKFPLAQTQNDRLLSSQHAHRPDAEQRARRPAAGAAVRDESGNGYDARVAPGGALLTPLGSKGANYTLVVRAALSGAPGVLLAGPDDSFGLAPAPGGGGALTLAFTSSNITYLLSNFTLAQEGLAESTAVIALAGTENGTSAWLNGTRVGDFLVSIDGTSVMEPMAFVAPVQTLGGTSGQIEKIELWDGIQESKLTTSS